MLDCWDSDAPQRPTFVLLCQRFPYVYEKLRNSDDAMENDAYEQSHNDNSSMENDAYEQSHSE